MAHHKTKSGSQLPRPIRGGVAERVDTSAATGSDAAQAADTADGTEIVVVAPGGAWQNVWLRRGVTVLLLLHLTAVVIALLAVAPRSYLAEAGWTVFRPYLEGAFLNHGYHFFAPEPGPSHLIRYEARLADGTTITGEFPNKEENWPRLFYHRHFMLSEHLNALGSNEETDDVAQRFIRSYAHHLMTKYDADEVDLYLRRHLIPLPLRVAEGMKLDDPSLYEEQALGTFKRDEL